METDDEPVAEEDEVIAQYPVYFSPQLKEYLYLLQFPLRPANRSLEAPAEARYRPTHQHLEVDYPTVWGDNTDSTGESVQQEKSTLTSTIVRPRVQNAVGYFCKNTWHLCPLHSTLQMKPSFGHMDRREELPEAPTSTGFTEVRTRYQRPESKRSKENRERQWAFIKNKMDAERKIDLKIIKSHTKRAKKAAKLLASKVPKKIDWEVLPQNYLSMFNPEAMGMFQKERMVTAEEVRSRARSEQVKWAAIRLGVFRYETVKEYVASDFTKEEIFLRLKECAKLVRGNWVINSCLVFPRSTRMAAGRDWILLYFREGHAVSRHRIARETRLAPPAVTDILKNIAVMSEDQKEWSFKMSLDHGFSATYPEIVLEQKRIWEEQKETLQTHFDVGDATNDS